MTEIERRRLVVLTFVASAISGDVHSFLRNTVNIDWPGAWLDIFTELAPIPRDMIDDRIRRAFLWAWRGDRDQGVFGTPIGIKWSITKDLEANSDLLVRCMKILSLPNNDPAVPHLLYRGQSLAEHQRGAHGTWWTSDPMLAEWFARGQIRAHAGQGAVLATIVQAEAIIWKLNREEFLLDPALLGDVHLIEAPGRYSAEDEDMPSPQRELRSPLLGLPNGYDLAAAKAWLWQGMPATGLDHLRTMQLEGLMEELAA